MGPVTPPTERERSRPTDGADDGCATGDGRSGGAEHVHDVLVVGGGPSGSSCAYWLAEAGWDVALVEKKVFPARRPAATA